MRKKMMSGAAAISAAISNTTSIAMSIALLILTTVALSSGCVGTTQTIVTQTRTTIPPEVQGDAASTSPSISTDGRVVAFMSEATNLVVGGTNGARSIYTKDSQSGETKRVSSSSEGVNGNKDSDNPVISGNGRFVAFDSSATNLIPNDANNQCVATSGSNFNCPDVFIKDLDSGVIKLVSNTAAGVQGNGGSVRPALSADGRFVAFVSAAGNLVADDTNGKADVFLKDMQTGAIVRVSVAADGGQGDDESMMASISADGRFVAFRSRAGNLVSNDGNGLEDVFLKDMQTGAITNVSTPADSAPGDGASGLNSLAVSGNGRFVVFESGATNLVSDDVNGKRDIFIKDTQSGATALVSAAASGAQGNEDSYQSVAISADGRFVAFTSDASNLVPEDANAIVGKTDIFLKDTQSGVIQLASTSTAGAAQAAGKSESVAISADGRFLAFDSDGANLVSGDTNKKTDIFFKDIKTGVTTRLSTSTADLAGGDINTETIGEDNSAGAAGTTY